MARHVEVQFGTLTRGLKHSVPQKEADIALLQKSFRSSKLHQYTIGRKVKTKDKINDVVNKGAEKLLGRKVLGRWIHLRSFERSMEEDWEDLARQPLLDDA